MSQRRPRTSTVVGGIGGVGAALLIVVAGFFGLQAAGPSGTDSGLAACSPTDLPAEAHETVADIAAGGPYEFPENDNTRFGNYEDILPDEELGYYREFTVSTPGLDHRGTRRIVTGGDTGDASGSGTDPEVWFYTDDHYESFCEITDVES